MEDLFYQEFLSQFFVCVLILALATGFWVSYLNKRKPYFKIVAFAAIFEALRVIPDSFLIIAPENLIALSANILLQFLGTAILLFALYEANNRTQNYKRNAAVILGVGFFAVAAYVFALPTYEQPSLDAYIALAPVLLVTILLIWEGWQFIENISASRILFSLSAMGLLMLRGVQPSLALDELYLAIYYMELVTYPIIIVSLMLAEVENTNKRISELLTDKEQSEANLQFIVNNTLDIILVADEVGLLSSWSKKAQEKFGYTAEQAIGKIHMDELFVGNPSSQAGRDTEEFEGIMESMNGSQLEVEVRMQTVSHKENMHSIYVLRDTTTIPTEGVLQSLLEADEEEIIKQ